MSAYGGNWQQYVDALYEYFYRDFIESKPTFRDRRWAVKKHPESQGKPATFWHIVSDGSVEEERLPDFRRCERIRWPRPIIDACESERVRLWRTKRGSSNRVLIALEDFSYVVILEDRTEYIMLWTAFHVGHSNRRRDLRREWKAWSNGQTSKPNP